MSVCEGLSELRSTRARVGREVRPSRHHHLPFALQRTGVSTRLRSSRKECGKRRKGRRKKLSFPNNELLPPVGRTLCFRLCAKKGFSQQSRHGEKVRALCISACFKVCSRRCRFFSPAPTGSESSNVANSSGCFNL